jgi:hypothetical protein
MSSTSLSHFLQHVLDIDPSIAQSLAITEDPARSPAFSRTRRTERTYQQQHHHQRSTPSTSSRHHLSNKLNSDNSFQSINHCRGQFRRANSMPDDDDSHLFHHRVEDPTSSTSTMGLINRKVRSVDDSNMDTNPSSKPNDGKSMRTTFPRNHPTKMALAPPPPQSAASSLSLASTSTSSTRKHVIVLPHAA